MLKPLHIRCSRRANNALLFSRWFDDIKRGNYVVVNVIKDNAPHPWIITAYLSTRLPKGDIVWQQT